jgi:phytol kinase
MATALLNFGTDIVERFLQGLPNLSTTILLVIIFIVWSYICAKIATYLKKVKKVRTGFTRKSFHFLVFISVAIINIVLGFSGVCLFGIIISGFIFYAILNQESSGLYLALARENDAPNSRLYVIIPYLSTLVGGLTISFLFPKYVILGYLICGLADASGEVIGTLYGKNRFEVKFFNFHPSHKSLEGCLSVFLLSLIVYSAFSYYQLTSLNPGLIVLSILSSLIITITEILSPKGFDNLTIQIMAVICYLYIIVI